METLFGFSVDDYMHSGMDLPMKSSTSSGVAMLEPYVPDPLPQRRRKNTNLRSRGNEREIMPGIFEPSSFNKFLTLKFDQEKRAQDLDMFAIEKEIVDACGREPNITFQSDGSLLIEVATHEESLKLQSLSVCNGTSAKCAPHRSLNQCKGVIRSTHLLKYSEERLLKEFENQKVVEVKQMNKYINGVLTPLPTYVLTFDLVKLPQKLKAAWLRLQIRPYVPAPRRCFHCQRFGHVSNSCRKKLKNEKKICCNCGQEEHGDCKLPSSCVNCAGNHPASSKNCARFILEREIQAVRAKENIPFSEAKRRVMDQFVRPGVSYASVLHKARTSQKPTVQKSPPEDQSVHKKNESLKSNSKRRLSGDNQDSLPSSKSNRYEILTDEMDAESIERTDLSNIVTESTSDRCTSGQVTNTLACQIVQAEIHAPPCSVGQVGVPASVELGESAGAVYLDGLTGPSGAPSLGGLSGLHGGLPSGGLGELPEELFSGGANGMPVKVSSGGLGEFPAELSSGELLGDLSPGVLPEGLSLDGSGGSPEVGALAGFWELAGAESLTQAIKSDNADGPVETISSGSSSPPENKAKENIQPKLHSKKDKTAGSSSPPENKAKEENIQPKLHSKKDKTDCSVKPLSKSASNRKLKIPVNIKKDPPKQPKNENKANISKTSERRSFKH